MLTTIKLFKNHINTQPVIFIRGIWGSKKIQDPSLAKDLPG